MHPMNWKTFFLRFAGLIALTFAGGFCYALTIHLLIAAGMMPYGQGSEGYGQTLTLQTAYVYMASILAAFITLFFQGGTWRNILYIAPLYAPSLYAVIQTVVYG